MKKIYAFIIPICITHFSLAQTVTISVDANVGRKEISPFIYGKNNNISDNPNSPNTAAEWQFMKDAGLRFTRENGGNNGTKYNWCKKLSSHPDWYNNVYAHDWDYAAKQLQDNLPDVQGMWGFQLIGKAASNTNNNFDDWNYNGSNWWSGVHQNLAGGGIVNGGGGSAAAVNGNTNLYLQNWPADSTVAIVDHWFGNNGLGLDNTQIMYWSMDNEVEIWNSTHDDVMPNLPSAEAFMQLYFAVAKKARAKFPNIKLVGPVPANEWQWYTWNNAKINVNGTNYNWLEFFIKRIGEEQTASGVRLLDVLDLHFYPGESNNADIVQAHRVYFDTTYVYPGANGVKTTAVSGWDNSITNENIFGRCNQWLEQYVGANHQVGLSVSEYGAVHNDANVTSVSYGSILGTFADNGVELFSPWTWHTGMWETMHLYSRYAQTTRVISTSSEEQNVSAYSSINISEDSMTVILVNRHLTDQKNVQVNIDHFNLADGQYSTKQLDNLPANETFVSHANNALTSGTVNVSSNTFTVDLPALSTTAVILKKEVITSNISETAGDMQINMYPNPVKDGNIFIDVSQEKLDDLTVEIFNTLGQVIYSKKYNGKNLFSIEIPSNQFSAGTYAVSLKSDGRVWKSWLVKM